MLQEVKLPRRMGSKKKLSGGTSLFISPRYRAFLHVPINIGKKIAEGMNIIEEAGLSSEPMVLSKNDTMWGAEILIPISAKNRQFQDRTCNRQFSDPAF